MSEELKPCPCGGQMELVDDQRHMKQKVAVVRHELVCKECGLTVKLHRSSHKLIQIWNQDKRIAELEAENKQLRESNEALASNNHILKLGFDELQAKNEHLKRL